MLYHYSLLSVGPCARAANFWKSRCSWRRIRWLPAGHCLHRCEYPHTHTQTSNSHTFLCPPHPSTPKTHIPPSNSRHLSFKLTSPHTPTFFSFSPLSLSLFSSVHALNYESSACVLVTWQSHDSMYLLVIPTADWLEGCIPETASFHHRCRLPLCRRWQGQYVW